MGQSRFFKSAFGVFFCVISSHFGFPTLNMVISVFFFWQLYHVDFCSHVARLKQTQAVLHSLHVSMSGVDSYLVGKSWLKCCADSHFNTTVIFSS
jgi:hypothetical protein